MELTFAKANMLGVAVRMVGPTVSQQRRGVSNLNLPHRPLYIRRLLSSATRPVFVKVRQDVRFVEWVQCTGKPAAVVLIKAFIL